MFGDEIVGGLKERRLGADGSVAPFQVADELPYGILLLRRQRPDNVGQALSDHSVYPIAVYRSMQDGPGSSNPQRGSPVDARNLLKTARRRFPTREIAGQRDMVDPENRNERLDT